MFDLKSLDVEKLTTLFLTYGAKIVGFIILLIATFIVAGWTRRIVFRSLSRSKLDDALANFFSKMAKWGIVTLGVITCLGIFGIQTASFAAVLASAGFAVGMALQGTLGHFASGVMLLIFKPFRPGQVIDIAGTIGKVAEIDLFSTMIDTPDNRRVIVPNGAVFGSKIINSTFHDTRRVDVFVGTDYAADLDKTREVLMTAISKLEHKLEEPEAAVALVSLGASSVDWAVRVWVKTENYWPTMDELTKRVKEELDKEKIGIPFPQMEINIPDPIKNNSFSPSPRP